MNHADVRSTKFWRAVLTIFALAVVAAVLLVGCSDARSSSSSGSPAVSGASQGQGAAISPDLIARAMTYLRERGPMSGWTRAVIVAERSDVSKGQWAAVALLPNRHLVPIENEMGDDVTALDVLVDVGDYVRWKRLDYGYETEIHGRTAVDVVTKGAVKP